MSPRSDDDRKKLREKYLKSFQTLMPPVFNRDGSAPVADAIKLHPDLEGLADVRKALEIMASTAHMPPASFDEPVTHEERTFHGLKTKLVMEFSASEASKAVYQEDQEKMRYSLRSHFEPMLARTAAEDRITISSLQREALLDALVDEILGCGPLDPLLRDPEISEIMVNGPRTIFVERRGKLERTDVRFFDDLHMMNILTRVVNRVGRSIDLSNPHVDARLADGSRVHAIIPPLALDGAALTIRKFKQQTLQMEDLLSFDALTPEMAYFLGACVKARINIVVSGGTGSGKTTVLNVLSTLAPSDQRIVTIEDAAELKVHESHPHVVRLESRPGTSTGKGAVTIRDLLRDALRMRPDRIIVGECRGGEAMDMLQAMNTGHDGSMTSTHANTSRDCLRRLEAMCLMAGLELPAMAIRAQIASAIEMIVHVKRYADGTRKVSEILEVVDFQEGDIVTRPIFWYEVKGRTDDGTVFGDYHTAEKPPSFMNKFDAEGLVFPSDIFGA